MFCQFLYILYMFSSVCPVHRGSLFHDAIKRSHIRSSQEDHDRASPLVLPPYSQPNSIHAPHEPPPPPTSSMAYPPGPLGTVSLRDRAVKETELRAACLLPEGFLVFTSLLRRSFSFCVSEPLTWIQCKLVPKLVQHWLVRQGRGPTCITTVCTDITHWFCSRFLLICRFVKTVHCVQR